MNVEEGESVEDLNGVGGGPRRWWRHTRRRSGHAGGMDLEGERVGCMNLNGGRAGDVDLDGGGDAVSRRT
jgi:hypothetical protein